MHIQNEELAILTSLLGTSATILSVLSAVLFVRVSDHLITMRAVRAGVAHHLEGFSRHINDYIENINRVVEQARKTITEARASILSGNDSREVLYSFHFGGSSGGGRKTVVNSIDIKECTLLVKYGALFKDAYAPIKGKYNKKITTDYIQKLRNILPHIDPVHIADIRNGSVAGTHTYSMVESHANTLESSIKKVKDFRNQLYSRPLIALDLFVIVFSITAFIVPLIQLMCRYELSKGTQNLIFVLIIATAVLCAYLLHLLYEIHRMGIFWWSEECKL